MGHRLSRAFTMVEVIVASSLFALLLGTGLSLYLIRARQDPREERELERVAVVSRFVEYVTRDARTSVAVEETGPGQIRVMRRTFDGARPSVSEVAYAAVGRGQYVRREGGQTVEFDLRPFLVDGHDPKLTWRSGPPAVIELAFGGAEPPVTVRVVPLDKGPDAPVAALDAGAEPRPAHQPAAPAAPPVPPSMHAPPPVAHGGRLPAAPHPPVDRGGFARAHHPGLHDPGGAP